MTATRPPSASVSSSFAGIYDVTSATYGATGNGTTDDTTAVQAAITAAKTNGGTVYFPPGSYKITSTLVCDNNPGKALRLTGAGGRMHFQANYAAELVYTAATGSLLQCHSVLGFEVDHLKFRCSNASHNGDVIDIDGNPLAADCQLWEIHHCSFNTAAVTTRSQIRLNKAIIGSIHHNHLTGAVSSLRVGDPAGSYVVAVEIHNNTYNNANSEHILVGTADGENITFRNETFESMPTNGAIHGSSNGLYTPTIEDCWFGDASSAGTWINDLTIVGGNYTGIISGNRMADATPTGFHFKLTGAWTLIGNSCEGGTMFQGTGVNPILIQNDFNTNVAIWETVEPTYFTALGNNCPSTATLSDRLPYRIALGCRGAPGGALATGDSGELLVLGSTNGSTLRDVGNKGAVYTTIASGAVDKLILQAGTNNNAREVVMAAGTTPTQQVRASGVGVGFYNTAPVAQAARAGQLTDSTGGTVTSTLAAGIADAVAKNAIASLAAKVNALETIVHNLGLSA